MLRYVSSVPATYFHNDDAKIAIRDRPIGNWHGQPRSREMHESKRVGDSRLCRESNLTLAPPSYLGNVLTDNRHDIVTGPKDITSNRPSLKQSGFTSP